MEIFASTEGLKETVMEEEESRPDRVPKAIQKTDVVASGSSLELEELNEDLITFASIKECKEKILDIEEKLEPHPQCCIYRVPESLRKINEEAYTPQVISIGPLHYGEIGLSGMEKQKIRYVREFSKRITEETWQEFVNFIVENEQGIRNCYAEMPKFGRKQFIMMILYDAVFIIEYLLRWSNDESDDHLLYNLRLSSAIRVDLQLLENQIPYFVLERLYNALASSEDNDLISLFLISSVFCHVGLCNGIPAEEVEVKHFTDLKRCMLTHMNRLTSQAKDQLRGADKYIPRIVKLHESGVKIKCFKGKCSSVDMRFEKKKLLWIPCLKFLQIPVLRIPRMLIYDETECLIRNIMALEQCHYPGETLVCNFFSLIDLLLDTEEDVNLLVEAGIIDNCVGDTAKIAKMFNDISSKITCNHSKYYDVIKELKDYYNSPWNHAKATLKSVYFSNPWRGTGTVAAIVLLVLTLVQTICSILQIV